MQVRFFDLCWLMVSLNYSFPLAYIHAYVILLKAWAVCRIPAAFASSSSIAGGRTSFNMARVSGGAVSLTARNTGKIGAGVRASLRACVCVLRLWNCPDLCVNNSPAALCYAANQCGSVPGNSKYLRLPHLRFSHPPPSPFLLLLGTLKALHTYNCSTWKCQVHI